MCAFFISVCVKLHLYFGFQVLDMWYFRSLDLYPRSVDLYFRSMGFYSRSVLESKFINGFSHVWKWLCVLLCQNSRGLELHQFSFVFSRCAKDGSIIQRNLSNIIRRPTLCCTCAVSLVMGFFPLPFQVFYGLF